jgi:Dyp-type peroxidase family
MMPSPATQEPTLAINEIPGNILLGFNKDFQALLFLEITDRGAFRPWLQRLARSATTTRDVLLFRNALRELRRRGAEQTVHSTWLEVAFSRDGLVKLVSEEEAAKFRDEAFSQGLDRRAALLGDAPGAAASWVIGGPNNRADALLLVAADQESHLTAEVDRLTDAARANGAKLLFCQRGARLPPEGNREHFGFRDGISQPGIRGLLSEDPEIFLTPRENPDDPDDGKPGQPLLWPGEFVFGYPGQDANATAAEGGIRKPGPSSLGDPGQPVAPPWACNGSYLVFRRLRQDVGGFRRFIREQASRLGLAEDLLEAKIVGRFRSGAPIARTLVDVPAMGSNACASNDFRFADDSPLLAVPPNARQCTRTPPAAPADFEALTCPFGAHIRKAYPRNDLDRFENTQGLERTDTETHRILRRGIPYGPPYPMDPPACDAEERGLLFLAYQTSIVRQFEHIQSVWANQEEARIPPPGLPFSAGQDLIIGQTSGKVRKFMLKWRDAAGKEHDEILAAEPFVVPTGGGYFFVPSVTALGKIARWPPQAA